MSWICKECGGKIVLQEDNIYEDTFTIKKDTTKRSRKAKKVRVHLKLMVGDIFVKIVEIKQMNIMMIQKILVNGKNETLLFFI